MSEVITRLRVKAIKERATRSKTLHLSDEDSEQLAHDFHTTVPVIWGSCKKFCKDMSFRKFKKRLKNGTLDDFTFRGMHIKWFCGSGPTFISGEMK